MTIVMMVLLITLAAVIGCMFFVMERKIVELNDEIVRTRKDLIQLVNTREDRLQDELQGAMHNAVAEATQYTDEKLAKKTRDKKRKET